MKIEDVKGLLEALNGDARNAMHSVLGFLELVGEGRLDAAQREYVEACSAAASRHFRDVEDVGIVLGLGPKQRSVIAHFVPRDVFGRVADAVGWIAGRKDIALLRDVDSSVPPVVAGDLDRIGQALFRMAEAVVSALDMGEGNGSHVPGSEIHINLRAAPLPDATDLTLEIVDSAAMLAPVLMRALQQDDFVFDASLSGSGALGLAAARKLATGLGGSVDASTDPLTGTRIAATFRLAVPVVSQLPPQPRAELLPGTEPAPEVQRALRILVAEDSEDSFQLFKAYLRDQPHTVERATNGEQAVESAATGTFDLLFMDICMPVMDGYAATKRIRELETGKDRARMPIVVLSAEDLRSQRRQGALVGCSGHLSKPLRKNELLEAIRTYSMRPSSTAVC